VVNCVVCSVELDDGARFCPACGAEQPQKAAGEDGDDPFIGQVINRNFRIDKLLGVGGMGKVYKARQLSLDKDVVIKLLHDHFNDDPQLVQRFQREARSASRLSHPNSIQVIDFGQDANGVLFMAIEFLDGRDLYGMLGAEGPFTAERLAKIMIQVCSALAEAHEQNVIHRDLKPENIMIVDHRGTEFVKVLDFGIAKIQDPDEKPEQALTQAGMVCGTPEYMSPEQARGQKLDHRSDLYALGVVVYQLATGELPFNADTAIGIVTKHILEQPDPPRQKYPQLNIHPDLEAIILKAMAKNVDERFSTAMEMVQAFEELLRTLARESSTAFTAPETPQAKESAPTQPANIPPSETQPVASPNPTLPTPTQTQTAAPSDDMVRNTSTTELVDHGLPAKSGGGGAKFAAIAVLVLLIGAGGALFLLKDQLFGKSDGGEVVQNDGNTGDGKTPDGNPPDGKGTDTPEAEAAPDKGADANGTAGADDKGKGTTTSKGKTNGTKRTPKDKTPKTKRDKTPAGDKGTTEKRRRPKERSDKTDKGSDDAKSGDDKGSKVAAGPSADDIKQSKRKALKAQTMVFSNPKKAYATAKEALKLNPKNHDAIKVIAMAHSKMGNKKKACNAMKDFVKKKRLSKKKGLPLLKMVGGDDACGVK